MIQNLVLDTNILISGYLWDGKPRQAIRLVKSTDFRLLHCKDSITELVRVLSAKFQLSAPEIHAVVLDIKGMGKSIRVFSKECPIKEDLTDNVFINLAIDGNAKIIVSGDSHLLNLKEYKKIKIITVSEFLSRYS
ncbi:MAG: putative toxin-antitoxin system toxin component, PIN family [Candidatus Brocadia sp. AMX2]|uniref:Nucleic acid-binding protein contains PIN domain n=1 Tax=Candidatus Brocadia sinica JPN1 TaxID=1197129 RepID=A0ABQ0JVP1_9BACT|nr:MULTISPECIES: putative toxin-antitoxin system toxin component, PIN family [Brocadia]MBC6930752.1 putative toxin-antitoxin system toxin component, PIN family [Candidatus Brocadia sp.]MBL1167721.1 putative toxin-antitoxin system toxin component, PIN family [Candidatus Brocadia sp. AMX1]NOG41334.1 putative toxin-antitoxin system toxin component, PIN family [Planctomycetota bacterium]GIK13658.1 MAG: PIN domain-containing protein [Candidatus Brocadia sinica]KAA0245606.1 MAG: putative toxin-antit